jgi:hypothetical protein
MQKVQKEMLSIFSLIFAFIDLDLNVHITPLKKVLIQILQIL